MESWIQELVSENGYKISLNKYWKEDEGYLITISPFSETVKINIHTSTVGAKMPMAVSKAMADIDERRDIKACHINTTSIQVSLSRNNMTTYKITEIATEIVNILIKHGVQGTEICQMCNKKLDIDEKSVIKLNGRMMVVHNKCYHDAKEDSVDQTDASKGSYLSGMLGAILFGAIGTIPWIIVGIMGWILSLLGVAIGISASTGYNKFNGKQGPYRRGILIGIVVIMVTLAAFVTQVYELFDYLNKMGITGVSLGDGLDSIFYTLQHDSEYQTAMFKNIIIGIVFGVLGAWRAIKENDPAAQKVKLKLELVQ